MKKVLLFRQLGRLVLDANVTDDQLRAQIYRKVSHDDLEAAMAEADRIVPPIDDNYFDLLAQRYSYLRQCSPAFLARLRFPLRACGPVAAGCCRRPAPTRPYWPSTCAKTTLRSTLCRPVGIGMCSMIRTGSIVDITNWPLCGSCGKHCALATSAMPILESAPTCLLDPALLMRYRGAVSRVG
jgi:hypothetical protein